MPKVPQDTLLEHEETEGRRKYVCS
ncbi:hypothetical protein MTR67_009141 [Solanum verrucosum]|uniref:Uncharacterized protein n=1 Tax=Solanum verrucosum TaxID=315347 RepID=A0AAF0TE68_SOLVR|nr:hypothetical protein MTR67_009141 [Solanum verrucosum]